MAGGGGGGFNVNTHSRYLAHHLSPLYNPSALDSHLVSQPLPIRMADPLFSSYPCEDALDI